MRKFNTFFAVAFASTCLSATSVFAETGPTVVDPVPSSTANPGAAPTKHALYSTWLDHGANGTLAAGFNPIDSTTVTCANAAGCTILMDVMAEAGGNSASGNAWAIVGYVDGSYVDFGPYQAALPTNGTYITGVWHNISQVAKGTHTVSFSLYVSDAASFGIWQATYAVYKP